MSCFLKKVSDEIRDDLEVMDLNTNRLLDLVNQLLDFRKTETQGFQLNFVECDVVDILQKRPISVLSLWHVRRD